ncbi:MAG: type II toxin-antitoxin system RelE/ParE family toxin [Bacteroidales bacterium]|nr:type II toxin-antitoxin system RelE/ParE family toxin [Bacteroidales bacterium]
MKVIVSERAEINLHKTADYIQKEFGQKAKKEFLQEIRHLIGLLTTNPYMWAIEPLLAEFPSTYRSFVVKRLSKIVYRIVDDCIEISDFWDCRRNPDALIAQLK